MAKINNLDAGTNYVAKLQVKTSSGWTNPTTIDFTTPEVLNPVVNMRMEDIKEVTAKVTWERNGTATERYVLIYTGPFGEKKMVILADRDSNKDLVTEGSKLHSNLISIILYMVIL